MEYTKAGMLKYIKEHMKSVNILPVLAVKSSDFFDNERETINLVLEFAQGEPLIVRSSSSMEDTAGYSNAGKFESILNVIPQYDAVRNAVEKVYGSYDTEQNEEVLIQPMLQKIKKSGVVFTADMDTFADYYTFIYY